MAIKWFNFNRMKSYILINKSFKIKNINEFEIFSTPKIMVESTEIDYSRFEEDICEFIKGFEYILINVIENIDLSLFYNHINSLKFEKYNFNDNNLVDFEGIYSLKYNKIKYQSLSKTVLGHESFHMASSVNDDNREYIGFMQTITNEDIGIGVGLNEGYTQILTERYIEKEDFQRYPLSQFFVKRIEDIIGQKNMEKMYFKADLLGLVTFFKKYNTRDNILKFIYQLDIVTTFEKIYNNELVDKKIIQYYFKLAFRDMSNFLFCTMMNKINIEKRNNNIDSNKLNKTRNKFIMELLGHFYYRDKEYALLNEIDLIKYSVKVRKKNK